MTTIPAQDGATLSDCPIRASAWHDSRGGPPRLSLACSELTQVAIQHQRMLDATAAPPPVLLSLPLFNYDLGCFAYTFLLRTEI
jgi:hypothetical protein